MKEIKEIKGMMGPVVVLPSDVEVVCEHKVFIFRDNVYLRRDEMKEIRAELIEQVKSGIVTLSNGWEFLGCYAKEASE